MSSRDIFVACWTAFIAIGIVCVIVGRRTTRIDATSDCIVIRMFGRRWRTIQFSAVADIHTTDIYRLWGDLRMYVEPDASWDKLTIVRLRGWFRRRIALGIKDPERVIGPFRMYQHARQ